MILNLENDFKNKLTGVVHVGAHEGQEMDFYIKCGASKIRWYEANPTIYDRLVKKIGDSKIQTAHNVAVCDYTGKIKFNVSNNDGSSSSILELKEHKKYYPQIHYESQIEVDCIKLDDENLTGFNSLFMDVQGAEYKVLLGAEKLIKSSIKYIYCEVNFEELYAGCATLSTMDDYLNGLNFNRIHLVDTRHGWGDALYVKI
jgi:FkbM family methyltransferase